MKVTGRTIRGARAVTGLSTQELGDVIGTSRQTIERAEKRGDLLPAMRGPTLIKLLHAFECLGVIIDNDTIRVVGPTARDTQVTPAE
jgi:DNA-binding XRE family transcriptional regulator